eukprot:jgi/Picsp_1/5451/NSC_02810-R1_catalytic hydrolase
MANHHEPIECMLLDLDDCLYYNREMSQQVAKNIRLYMVKHLGMDEKEAFELSTDLYFEYGTTLAGLVSKGYEIDYDHWHDNVHACLPYETYLKPDPGLRSMLNGIPVPKYVFTNADIRHAKKCLGILGLMDCFTDIICFETLMEFAKMRGHDVNGKVVCKPNPVAMRLALEYVEASSSSTLFFDDSARNVSSAHKLSIRSVLVNPNRIDCVCSSHIHSIHDIPRQLPWLVSVGDGRPPEEEVLEVSSPRREEYAAVAAAEEKPVIVQA